MNDIIENNNKQRSAGQSADRHKKFTIAVIAAMVICILVISIWLVRMTDTTQFELENNANLNVPITSSTARVITRKKQFKHNNIMVPTRKKPPKNIKPREELPPNYGESVKADSESLPPGVLIN